MSDTLKRIKRAVLAGHYRFTLKAQSEIYGDDLDEVDVLESIVYASGIYKTIRSTSSQRTDNREYLHVIVSDTLDGIRIYSKGKLSKEAGHDVYYVCVSAKRAS